MNIKRVAEYANGYRMVVRLAGDCGYTWRISHLDGFPAEYYVVDGCSVAQAFEDALMEGRDRLEEWAEM